MSDFNRGDFFYDRQYLSSKYRLIGGGTESFIYKVSNDMVAKRFHEPRNLKVKHVHDTIISCNPQTILTSNDFLIANNKIYTQFIEYFAGKQSMNIYDINFDLLSEFIRNLVIDVEELACNGIEMHDITPSSFIYSDSDMKLIDTTKYQYSRYSYSNLYQHNLNELFSISGYFEPKQYQNYYLNDLINISGNRDLEYLKDDYNNYYFYIKEVEKTYKEVTNINVKTINEGRNLVKLLK